MFARLTPAFRARIVPRVVPGYGWQRNPARFKLASHAGVNKMRRYAFVLLLLSFFIANAGFAQEQRIGWDKVQVKVQKVSGNVYLIQGFGGNVGAFVSDDELVLIDCEELRMGPRIEAALKTLSDKPVKYVLNTHWHGDHAGGNAYFGKTANLIAHGNMRKKMATSRDARITNLGVSLPATAFSARLRTCLLQSCRGETRC
jgi:hypothetical protein